MVNGVAVYARFPHVSRVIAVNPCEIGNLPGVTAEDTGSGGLPAGGCRLKILCVRKLVNDAERVVAGMGLYAHQHLLPAGEVIVAGWIQIVEGVKAVTIAAPAPVEVVAVLIVVAVADKTMAVIKRIETAVDNRAGGVKFTAHQRRPGAVIILTAFHTCG